MQGRSGETVSTMWLEDEAGDIIGKARRGLGLDLQTVALRAGIEARDLARIESCELSPSPDAARRLAEALRLNPDALCRIAAGSYRPRTDPPERWGCIRRIESRYGGMSVNAYMIWDDTSLHAAVFDTGTDFNAIRKAVDENGLTLRFVCLTHTHGDHTAVLEQVRSSFSPVVLCSPAEPVPGGQAVREGDVVEMESLSIAVLETDGHSPGGLTFHVTGFRGAPGAAATGDALFAGSVGGARVSYDRLLANVRGKILTLPDDTLLLPGHGPMTTVALEKANNPFAV